MTDEDYGWYAQMADAVSERKKAIAGITRWQATLARAEKKIADLAAQRPVDAPAHAEPTPEPVEPSTVPAPDFVNLDPSTV